MVAVAGLMRLSITVSLPDSNHCRCCRCATTVTSPFCALILIRGNVSAGSAKVTLIGFS